jgi:hypothetical protein
MLPPKAIGRWQTDIPRRAVCGAPGTLTIRIACRRARAVTTDGSQTVDDNETMRDEVGHAATSYRNLAHAPSVTPRHCRTALKV